MFELEPTAKSFVYQRMRRSLTSFTDRDEGMDFDKEDLERSVQVEHFKLRAFLEIGNKDTRSIHSLKVVALVAQIDVAEEIEEDTDFTAIFSADTLPDTIPSLDELEAIEMTYDKN